MGNKHSCCVYTSPSKTSRKPQDVYGYEEPGIDVSLTPNNRSATSLPGVPHISDRENYPEGKMIFNECDLSFVMKIAFIIKDVERIILP